MTTQQTALPLGETESPAATLDRYYQRAREAAEHRRTAIMSPPGPERDAANARADRCLAEMASMACSRLALGSPVPATGSAPPSTENAPQRRLGGSR